jgi:predicted urease superfamily metal-dependent hydrolase
MVAALAADLVLRYTEYTTMLAKKEDIEGVGESGGLFSDYHISMWQVTNCHLEEWLDLTDDERAAVLSDHSRVARDLLVDLQRLAPEIDVAIVMPWHREQRVPGPNQLALAGLDWCTR